MQQEYKNAIEQISLSDDDKARILANVKREARNRDGRIEDFCAEEIRKRPVISLRRMGAVAACFVIGIGGILLYSYIIGKNGGVDSNTEGRVSILEPDHEVAWVELESIEEIGERTDCKTYTLSNVPRKYRLKKIEVANAQRRVRLTYRNREEHDKILFEYKEAEDAPELMSQFQEENELSTEVVEGTDVTMFGEEKCDGMIWKKASCTFAVRMTRACSKREAKKLVSGAAEGMENARDEDRKTKVDKSDNDSADGRVMAVGWSGNEKPSTPGQRKRILKKVFDLLGFRVTVIPPGENIAYKLVEEYESFAFHYPDNSDLGGKWLVGYAGWNGCPDGVMKGFEEVETVEVNQILTVVYENKGADKLFCFKKQGIEFTLLVPELETTEYEQILGDLFSIIRISMDDGLSDDESDLDGDDDVDDGTDEKDESSHGNKNLAACKDAVLKIQDAVSERSIQRLMSYIEYPVIVDNQGTVAANPAEFISVMNAGRLFTSAWIDAIVSFDVSEIRQNTKSFVMGNDENGLYCKVKDDSVVITEIYTEAPDSDDESAKATPSEE